MKRQNYRRGIPAGIGANGTVADKVGFLDGLLHDAGLVYSQKGDFILVILTEGSSWSDIAALTQSIYGRL
jgi:beta-lactamase class A